MSHFVVAWESGSDVASLHDAWLIGQAIAERGHRVSYVVGEPVMLAQMSGTQGDLTLLQAPSVPGAPALVMKPPRIGGFADHMALQGYNDPATLRTLAGAWRQSLKALSPDAIVAVGAPVAWLVGPTIAPTLVAGEGWTLPPVAGDSFPRLSSDIAPVVAPATLLENANGALASLGATPVASAAEILGRCVQALYGAPYYDPYVEQRRKPSLGLLGVSPRALPTPVQPRLAVLLDVYCPNIEALIVALAGLDAVGADIYVRGATRGMREFLAAQPGLTVCNDFGAALAGIAGAAAVVHHGSSTVATHALALGRGQLVIPWLSSHHVLTDKLKAMGVTWTKSPGASIHEIGGTLRAVVNDALIMTRSQHFSRELLDLWTLDALPAIVDMAESAARTPVAAPAAPAPDSESAMTTSISAAAAAAAATSPLAAPVAPVTAASARTEPVVANTKEGAPAFDSFCGMPFQHMCIGSEATARICCMSPDMVGEDGVPLSLYTNSADEIWNSQTMRETRRKMLTGERVAECEVCYANEAATAVSYRTTTGRSPLPEQPLDVEQLRRDGAANGYRVAALPEFIKLELGNLCNLKCRMCYGGNSSEIERDPVHGRWAGGVEPLHALWQGDVAMIGPDLRIGVRRSGLHSHENIGNRWLNWTDGHAQFDVPISAGTALSRLDISFDKESAFDRAMRVMVNGQVRHLGRATPETGDLTIDLQGLPAAASLTIDIQSERAWNRDKGRLEGLPVDSIRLYRVVPALQPDAKVVLKPRLDKPGLWYKNDDLVYNELFGNVAQLKRLYVTGGEPLLEPRYAEILDFLIKRGVAPNVDLELTTNCTVIDEDVLEQLHKFKSLILTVSVDGVGAVQEYIRYPARWPVIEKNIRILRSHNFNMCAIPVVQAYNMLGLADICRFAREVDIAISMANVVRDPSWLQISKMPVAAHRLAAQRLADFTSEHDDEWSRNHFKALIHHFNTFDEPLDRESLRRFMLFTNDLDISRGQNFRESLPELYGLIVDAGVEWNDATLFANTGAKRITARDRVHAWI